MADIRLQKILKSLKKIQHKEYELYVLSGIIHRLNNPEIKYMFQQYARRDGEKHALIDLYLPQFRIAIEVDEAQHNSDYGKTADEQRLKEIAMHANTDMRVFALDARESGKQDSDIAKEQESATIRINPLAIINFEDFANQHLSELCASGSAMTHKMFVLRVICHDEAGPKGFEELNSSIDFVVSIIKRALDKSIRDGLFRPFDNKEPVKHYQDKGGFSIDDDTELESVTDICTCFGVPSVSTGGREFAGKYFIWWPKEGFEGNVWSNELSDDGKTILECPNTEDDEKRKQHFEGCKTWGVKHQGTAIRIVFYRRMDAMKSEYYSFKGVFELQDKPGPHGECVWKRIEGGDKFKLPKPYDSAKLKEYVETLESVYPNRRRKINGIKNRIEAAEAKTHMLKDLYHIWKDICEIDKDNVLKISYRFSENYS